MACSSHSIQLTGVNKGTNSNTTLADNLSQFSISIWVKYSLGIDYQALILKSDTRLSTPGWELLVNNPTNGDNIYFSVTNGSTDYFFDTGSTVVSDNNWHNIITTYDSAVGGHIYVDGTDVTSTITGSLITSYSNGHPVTLATTDDSTFLYPYTGLMDDTRIWNVVLSPSDAALIAAGGDPVATPIAYWKMEEGSGVILGDSTGNGNIITFNSLAWSVDTPSALPPCGPLTISLSDSSISSDSMVDSFGVPLEDNTTTLDSAPNSFSVQSAFLVPLNIPVVEHLVNQLVPASVKTYFRIEE